MNVTRKRMTIGMLTLLMGLAGTGSAVAASTPVQDNGYSIVALGDSVTAGYEPGVLQASDSYGYADRLYEQALLHGRAQLSNYALLGLRTEGFTNLLKGAVEHKPLTADQLQSFASFDERVKKQAEVVAASTGKIAESLGNADLVVLTIGGNDFTDLVEGLAGKSTDDAIKAFNAVFGERLNNYAEKVQEEILLIHQLAPNAAIEIADQYLPVSKLIDAKLYDTLYAGIDQLSARLNQIAKDLNGQGINLSVIPVGSAFKGSETQYVHISLVAAQNDVHPTQAGYARMAEAFAKPVWGSYTDLPAIDKSTHPVPALYIKGQPLNTQNTPKLKNNSTFLALSDVAAATGAELKWDARTRTALFRQNGREVKLTIGSKVITVNGAAVPLNDAPYLEKIGKNEKTYVPLTAITQGLNYQVVYRPKLHTAFINP